MFLDNLSASVVLLCHVRKLTYESASEQCNISARYFGDIARRKTAPTITTLEKLCSGFNLTPNELLLNPDHAYQYRLPMKITNVRSYPCCGGVCAFAVCPRCSASIERDYQDFCDRCGQFLNWENISNAVLIPSGR